jgi:hypothetical protein
MVPMSACIIPLGPDFQDPSASANYAPYFESAIPDFNSIVTPPQLTFTLTVTDPNLGDNLYVEWFADYPGANYRSVPAPLTFPHSMNNQPLHQPVTATIDCIADHLAPTNDGEHRIEVIVADRPFVDPVPPETRLDLVQDPGFVVRGSWILEQLSCPSQ